MLRANKSRLTIFSIALIVASLVSVGTMRFGTAQSVTYIVSQEWVHVQINFDASINIEYNLTFTYLSGQPQGIVTVGMPQSGFQILNVQDLSGNTLQFLDVSNGNYFGIDVNLKGPIVLNQPYTFVVDAYVPRMIYADQTNPGNDGLQFFPTTFASAQNSISDLRVTIRLPLGVQGDKTISPTGFPFDSESIQEGSLVVYWERTNWPQDQTFQSGVSFPQEFISPLSTPSLSPMQPSPSIPEFPFVFISASFAMITCLLVLFGRKGLSIQKFSIRYVVAEIPTF